MTRSFQSILDRVSKEVSQWSEWKISSDIKQELVKLKMTNAQRKTLCSNLRNDILYRAYLDDYKNANGNDQKLLVRGRIIGRIKSYLSDFIVPWELKWQPTVEELSSTLFKSIDK